MERYNLSHGYKGKKSARKRQREEEDETIDRSKANEKPSEKLNKSNDETRVVSNDIVKCSICLDTVNSSIMKSLPCAHVYHEECINGWLKVSDVCPICRWLVTADTNDSSIMEAARSNSEYEMAERRDSVLDERYDDFVLNDWVHNYELEETLSDRVDGNDSPHIGSDESRQTSTNESESSNGESESEESNGERESEESNDECESEESNGESESEKSNDESYSDEWSVDDDFY